MKSNFIDRIMSNISRHESESSSADSSKPMNTSDNSSTSSPDTSTQILESPLTQTQLGIFLECMKHEGEAIYNTPYFYRLSKQLDLQKLSKAFETSVAAHPILNARFSIDENGEPMIKAVYSDEPTCTIETLSEKEMEELKPHLMQPFNLLKDRLYRIRLFQTETNQYLFIDFHHIIYDGSSRITILKDTDSAYRGETVEKEDFTAFDHALQEQADRQSESYEIAKNWYLNTFGSIEQTSLPEGDRKEKETTYGHVAQNLNISYNKLRAFCKEHGTTQSALTSAAFGYVLSAYTRSKDVMFATIYNGRNDVRTQRTMSMMVKTLPVYCEIKTDQTIDDYLKTIKEQRKGAMTHDIYSFAELTAETGLSGEVIFAYQGNVYDLPSIGGADLEDTHLDYNATGVTFSLQLWPIEDNFHADVQYHSNKYSENYIRQFIACYEEVLRNLLCKNLVSEITLLDNAAQEKMIALSKGNDLEFDHSRTFVDDFVACAKKQPDALAVVCNDTHYTYGELDALSNGIAHQLMDDGVKPGEYVCIMLPRCREFVASFLGIMKAGAAYVPVDKDYPEDRKQYMIEDSGAKVVITEEYLEALNEKQSNTQPVNLTTPEGIAYMIYTSGSTGKPKGVSVSHHSISTCAAWQLPEFELKPGKNNLHHPSFSFDASTFDLFYPLAAGATIHILDENLRKDMNAMAEYIRKNNITGMTTSTALGMALLNEYDLPMEYVMLGGEKFMPVKKTNTRLYNGYGPTEFTVCSSFHIVDQEHDEDIPIGRPVPNSYSFVCDNNGNLLPQGIAGELCLSGDQIAQGYWNREELTTQKFCQTKFGFKVYHTGDLVKWNEQGELDFLGRIDTQVKLRGFRIEMGEIENQIKSYPGILQVCAAVKTINGSQHLCAYYTASDSIDTESLKTHVAAKLTEYMVPDAFVQLEAMPLTPNGKINLKALPVPELTAEEIILPENEQEKALYDISTNLLGNDQFGVTTNLLSIGLTSLSAMRLSSMIKQKLDVPISTKDIMLHPTIRELAEAIIGGNDTDSTQMAHLHEAQEYYPLTENQRGVYIDWEMHREALQYNTPSVQIIKDATAEQLKEALCYILEAHPYMKTRLAMKDGEIMQHRMDVAEKAISIQPLQQEPDVAFFQNRVRPFDLFEENLYRFEIYKTPTRLLLFMDIHHIIFDGTSGIILLKDLTSALQGETLKAETYTAFDRALDEKEMMASDLYTKAESYFDRLFADFEVTTYPRSKHPDTKKAGMGHSEVNIPGSDITAFCRKNGVTENSYFMTMVSQTFHRLLRQDSLMMAAITNGRMNAEMQQIVGMFVQTLPVVTKVSCNKVLNTVREMQQQYIETQSNSLFPYTRVVEKYDAHAEILFGYQGGISDELDNQNDSITISLDTVKMPITIMVYPNGNDYTLSLEYDSSLFSQQDMDILSHTIQCLSEHAAENAATPMHHLPLVSKEDSKELIALSKGMDLEFDHSKTFIDYFVAYAQEHPETLAVVCNDTQYTYGELDALSNGIAHKLIDDGIKPGEYVCIMLPKCKEFVASYIGVMKAGAAYVPVDKEYPEDRRLYMIEDSGAKVVITEEYLEDLIGQPSNINTQPINLTTPEGIGYMIYTSGSTGKPKGVSVTHLGISACAAWLIPLADLKPGKINILHPSFSFDASTFDLIYPLEVGVTIHVLDEIKRKDINVMAEYIREKKITGMTMSTAMGMALLNEYDLPIEYAMLGGEKFMPVKKTKAKLYNVYGPTEFTCVSSYQLVDQDSDEDIPIGRPVPNSYSFICDNYGNLMPRGIAGELCLSGVQISKGYWGREELTAQKFCETNFGFMVYHTGDLVKWNNHDTIDFLGRIDTQVKLRGFRIEMGEIESQIKSYPGILHVCATVKTINGNDHLCAYYTAADTIDTESLRAHVAAKLTEYMVPDAFVQLDAMPLTPNGKINIKVLPVPTISSGTKYVAPRNDIEQFFCNTIRQVLNLEKVGINDDFFKIGGTSIVAMRLAVLISNGGYKMVYKDIFDHPTPSQMAAFVSSAIDNQQTADSNQNPEFRDYDYFLLDEIITKNRLETYLADTTQRELGTVLLTGATGFLGIHVLHELIKDENVPDIYCLVRHNQNRLSEQRLRMMLYYYFEDDYKPLFGTRIHVIEGDITQPGVFDNVPHTDTVINCAANVKHFSTGTAQEDINVGGVKACIEYCLREKAMFIQTSTCSVGGQTVSDSPCPPHILKEDELYIGQDLPSKYLSSKYMAERAVIEAIRNRGLRAKIMRLGNLSSRSSDGEFQINFSSNSFMGRLKSFQMLGVIPYGILNSLTEFSPIDDTAKAILLLSRTNDGCSIFHAVNFHRSLLSDVVGCMNNIGCEIRPVEQKEFDEAIRQAYDDPKKIDVLQSLLSYSNMGNEKFTVINSYDSDYTTQVLYRLGFSWDITTWDYMERFLQKIRDLGFFDDDYERE